MSIVSPMLVERTERGDEMFMAMIERHCQHVLDTDALADPARSRRTPEPLQPNADDEGPHPPTDEPLWSESWYFDFADPGQDVGGWLRLGLIPNQGHAWINALLCGPDMPTIAVLDFEAAAARRPHPRQHRRRRPRARGRRTAAVLPGVAARRAGEAYDDPADLLRGEPGRPVDVAHGPGVDHGGNAVPVPPRRPRYEIPCTVSGTVTADGRSFTFTDVAGQRDHSWAARDWWSMEWVWSALHLDDGTHVHGRRPADPRRAADGRRATCSAPASRSSNCRPSSRGRRSATNDLPRRHHARAHAG